MSSDPPSRDSSDYSDYFLEEPLVLGSYISFSVDPVATLEVLSDNGINHATAAISSKKYIGYVKDVRANTPVKDMYPLTHDTNRFCHSTRMTRCGQGIPSSFSFKALLSPMRTNGSIQRCVSLLNRTPIVVLPVNHCHPPKNSR
jgi:hypothetical protein